MSAYFNSPSEDCNVSSGSCAAHPDWVLADDFDHGSWYATGNEPGEAANNGWFGCNDLGPNNDCRNPPPPAVSPNGSGRGGSGYAAMSSPQGGEGGDSALAMHGLYPADATYSELYFRFYLRLLSGYTANNNQKFISLIRSAYQGGIDQGGIGRSLVNLQACPQWSCGLVDEGYLDQNQGNDITLVPGTTWYFIEIRVKLNTFDVRNGVWQMWINDCGSDGVCTGSPTLRASYTDVGWIGNSSFNGPMGSMWFDIWGNPSDVGTMYIDNLVVSTSGPIGFVGSEGGGSAGFTLGGWRAHA